jgi:hypothetical protein
VGWSSVGDQNRCGHSWSVEDVGDVYHIDAANSLRDATSLTAAAHNAMEGLDPLARLAK